MLEQVRTDARRFDQESIAVGPFARLDAGAVAAREGKTRGAVTNLFGSQSAFQAETMALALNTWEFIERIEYPDPAAFATADEWVDAFFAGESARGPVHRADPEVTYASLWALWLSTVPYGLWSERASAPGIEEQRPAPPAPRPGARERPRSLPPEAARGDDPPRPRLGDREPVEGVWLNQCLTRTHPSDPSQPVAELLRRSGRLLWAGATVPR